MKCELCNSARREPEQRLCEPCIEAVIRLWTIANGDSLMSINNAREALEQRAKSQTGSVAAPPVAALL